MPTSILIVCVYKTQFILEILDNLQNLKHNIIRYIIVLLTNNHASYINDKCIVLCIVFVCLL